MLKPGENLANMVFANLFWLCFLLVFGVFVVLLHTRENKLFAKLSIFLFVNLSFLFT